MPLLLAGQFWNEHFCDVHLLYIQDNCNSDHLSFLCLKSAENETLSNGDTKGFFLCNRYFKIKIINSHSQMIFRLLGWTLLSFMTFIRSDRWLFFSFLMMFTFCLCGRTCLTSLLDSPCSGVSDLLCFQTVSLILVFFSRVFLLPDSFVSSDLIQERGLSRDYFSLF